MNLEVQKSRSAEFRITIEQFEEADRVGRLGPPADAEIVERGTEEFRKLLEAPYRGMNEDEVPHALVFLG